MAKTVTDPTRDLLSAVELLHAALARETLALSNERSSAAKQAARQASTDCDRAIARCLEAVKKIQALQASMPEARAVTGQTAIALQRMESLMTRRRKRDAAPRVCRDS